jgi:aminopeptidase YwaD
MNRKISFKYSAEILSLSLCILLNSCSGNREVNVSELRDHVKYLSSDSLKGRLTGSAGDSLAAEYIRKELLSFGLVPLKGDGLQRFEVTKRVVSGKNNSLKVNMTAFERDTDFIPLSFSSNGSLKSEVVFAGYGFNINTDSLKWNDYNNIDVKGKWVLILRADPEVENNKSSFIQYSGDRDKALHAKDMGAAGVLLVSGPLADPQDAFEQLNTEGFSVGIPTLRIRRKVADAILSGARKNIETLERNINKSRKPSGFATKTTVDANAEIVRETANTRNVIMILPGEDGILKNEYVIIGAHFDHLGMGGPGSSSRAPDTIGVHHGADDNASGVSMMLELAEKFAHSKGSHKRSIVCLAFTGEEEGLLGSKHFTDDPGIDLTKVNAMINLDMVGRFNDSARLQISGVGTATGLRDLVNTKSDTSKIRLRLSDEGYGPSDHSSFYFKNIPVLFYFTGAHLDYHTPSDTWDKLNYQGMADISQQVFNISKELANSTERLQFKEAGPKVEPVRYRRGKGVSLGIMPDFAGIVKNGLRADAITPGKPAALGGMKKGDIITAINSMTVNNIQDYMSRMSQLKHGQTISVEVLRNGKKEVLLIQL